MLSVFQTCYRKKYCGSSVGFPPQTGLDHSVKDLFYENLQLTQTKTSASEILFVCGDFNGHIVMNTDGYKGVHSGREFGRRKLEG